MMLWAFAGAPSFAGAGELPKIAVYVMGGKSADENNVLGAFMLEALIKSGKYAAIERTDDFVAQIDREQAKQRSGAVDDSEIRRVGKQAGVQFVCVVNLSHAFGSSLISARIIDVETAMVIATNSMESEEMSLREIRAIAGGVVGSMLGMRITKDVAAMADNAAVAAAEERSRAVVAAAEENARAAKAEAGELERARAAAAAEAETERRKAAEASKTAETERRRAAEAEAKAQKAAKALAEEKRKAAESSLNAAGLRGGIGNMQSIDAFLKRSIGQNWRLDLFVGFREYNYEFAYAWIADCEDHHEGVDDMDAKQYLGAEAAAFVGRTWRGEMVTPYAGAGIAGFVYEARYYDIPEDVGGNNTALREILGSIGVAGQAGVELNMGKMTLGVDVRPILYIPLMNSFVDYLAEIRFTAGMSIGYKF